MPGVVSREPAASTRTVPAGASVLLLATQVYSSNGGVQAYMRRLLEAFDSYTSFSKHGYGVVTLSDGSETKPEGLERCQLSQSPTKIGYTACALRAAVRLRPQIVVAGHLGVTPVAMMLQKLGLTRSTAVVLHGIEAWRRCPLSDRIASAHASTIIATTGYTAREFSRLNGIGTNKTQVIPLALACDQLPAQYHGLDSRWLRILTVGRLVQSDAYKGIDTLIMALARLRNREPQIHLDIVGTGDDMHRLLQIARIGNVCHMVRFRGSVSDEELERLYAECDIFALPSGAEGFGIVFLEAMRHAKPCIGGNHGGTPEVIEHGSDGLLVQHGDVGGLVHAIEQLADSPPLRKAMGLEAQHKIAARYLFGAFEANWHRALGTLTETT